MSQPKKLIEVSMPIKEISAESVRDKSIRHGHISTLHLWWARRPLPVCRAVIFASLVPDPLDPFCPKAFKNAVADLLGNDKQYKPYDDIPWTSIYDPMEDNLRNRLQMFIGKFTDDMQHALLHHQPTPAAGKQISDASLIKWDNKNNENIIKIAQKLIWVAYNADKYPNIDEYFLIQEFEAHYHAIKQAEAHLYQIQDRHDPLTEGVAQAQAHLHQAIEAFLDKMPKVFDPFAGGGAIPLEAARLGCRSFGNDINPVAHIIQKGSLEFPQKFGKPIRYSKTAFLQRYGEKAWDNLPNEQRTYTSGDYSGAMIPNRLAFDVAFFAKKLLAQTEQIIGQFYPADEKGKKPIAYYWAKVGNCANPSCGAEVPLLKQFYLANTKTKQVYLQSIIHEKNIDFKIAYGKCDTEGWVTRGNFKCPCCGNTTDVKTLKNQFIEQKTKEKILAVIWEGQNGKEYKLPTQQDIEIIQHIPTNIERPDEKMQRNSAGGDTFSWGMSEWGQMFSNRQLLALQTLVQQLQILKKELLTEGGADDYGKAIVTYLAILIDRVAVANTSFGVWHTGRETLERIMSRQAIPMVFDYPESNPFCSSTGSVLNQIDWLIRYIESESHSVFITNLQNASSGDKYQFEEKYLTTVVTDPPYYDAIAYADISDFFYVWLKRTLGDVYPLNFATPQTPKAEECTALKHHHDNDKDNAKKHFEQKLTQIFEAIEHQTTDVVSIMFAHQSTEAWTTLCNAILGAKMNINGSWATDTEMTGALKTDKSFLASSVTVACRPLSNRHNYGNFKQVKRAIDNTISNQVQMLYGLGFRGADLLTACFGQAVSEFGQYERVEKADGSEVTVSELLEIARESAFTALLRGFDGDDETKFYIGWLQLYGFAESDFDDAAKFSRIGLTIDVKQLFAKNILLKKDNSNKQTLGSYKERIAKDSKLGEREDSSLIDQVHRALGHFQGKRKDLLSYIFRVATHTEGAFWRVLTSLREVLPNGSEDHTQVTNMLSSKENLLREAKEQATQATKPQVEQTALDL